MAFPMLTKKGQIGPMRLKNRMIMSSMGVNMCNLDGSLTEEFIAYNETRAKGGVGLVQVGSVTVAHPEAVGAPNQAGFARDDQIPQYRELADRVHKYGAKLSLQLQHPGLVSGVSAASGYAMLTPSVVEQKPGDVGAYHELNAAQRAMMLGEGQENMPVPEVKACTKEDIEWVKQKFLDAARRCVEAGVDGIEIHGSHGYLFDSFLNPRYNKRADEYGGSVENRARFLTETVALIKKHYGNKLAIMVKLTSVEMLTDNGITNEDAIEVAKLLEKAGADAICCSSYAPTELACCPTSSHIAFERNIIVPYARKIKAAVNIPTTCVGRIDIPDAEKFIEQGDFDFLQIGRKLLADPELPNKVTEDRYEDARLCLNCYYCVSSMYEGRSVGCAINRECCNETVKKIAPAKKKKFVLVVGGGPAGMEAARVAAERGHNVVLAEKGNRLGGTVFFGSVCTPTNYNIVTYLSHRLTQLKVDVRLNTTVDKKFIDSLNPDEIFFACGSKRELPPIPGRKQRHVLDGDTTRELVTGGKIANGYDPGFVTNFMCTCGRLLGMLSTPEKVAKNSHIWMPIKKEVTLIGGELVGLEMAEFLQERGRKVTILEEGDYIGDGLALVRRWKVAHDVVKAGADVHILSKATSIGKDTVDYEEQGVGKCKAPAQSVIVCQGATPNTDLIDQMKSSQYAMHCVGDCNEKLSYIDGAVHEAYDIASQI